MHSLAIAVLAKEWVGMPFLSEILSENLSFSSVAQLSLNPVWTIPLIIFSSHYFGIANVNANSIANAQCERTLRFCSYWALSDSVSDAKSLAIAMPVEKDRFSLRILLRNYRASPSLRNHFSVSLSLSSVWRDLKVYSKVLTYGILAL